MRRALFRLMLLFGVLSSALFFVGHLSGALASAIVLRYPFAAANVLSLGDIVYGAGLVATPLSLVALYFFSRLTRSHGP